MSVDIYVNNEKYNKVAFGTRTIISNIEIKSADSANGDIFRLATLPVDAVIKKILIKTTALTAAADNDIGLYLIDGGAVVDADILADGQTLASASKTIDGLGNVSVANTGKTIYDLYKAVNTSGTLLDQEKYVDIALTVNTASTANGNISVEIEYLY